MPERAADCECEPCGHCRARNEWPAALVTDLLRQAMEDACQAVKDAVDLLKTGDIALGDFQRLAKRCKNISDTYRKECGGVASGADRESR